MMNDILDELTAMRPQDLDQAAPGWNVRREELLAELNERAATEPDSGKTSNTRRRVLLVGASAAAVAIVAIVGAAIQTGQRVQPDPAQTVTTPTVDPNRPVHQVGRGEYFLRRTSITTEVGTGAQSYQRAVWFDDQGRMWSVRTAPAGTTTAAGPLERANPDNPLSFTDALGDDPAAVEKVLTKRQPGVVDSIQQAAEANLSPRQYRTLQRVLLRRQGSKRLADGADSLSRPAVVVQAPGRMGTVVRVLFRSGDRRDSRSPHLRRHGPKGR